MNAASIIKGTTVGLICSAVFASGLLAAALFVAPRTPDQLKAAEPIREVPVVAQVFADARSVQLDLEVAADTRVTTSRGGRVTSTECATGATVSSGASLMALDGQQLIALATVVPLWRNIGYGTTGDDVKGLQAELARLGYPITPSGVAGRETIAAVSKLFSSVGEQRSMSFELDASRIVWIPAPHVTVSECDATLGAQLDSGAPLITTQGPLLRASMREPMPEHLVPGARVLQIGSASIPVGAGGVLSTPSDLAQVIRTPGYRQARGAAAPNASGAPASSDQTASNVISAEFALSHPVDIAVIPPSAVYDIHGQIGCVADARRTYAVSIVGSQLGQSYVHFESADAPSKVALAPRKAAPCQ